MDETQTMHLMALCGSISKIEFQGVAAITREGDLLGTECGKAGR